MSETRKVPGIGETARSQERCAAARAKLQGKDLEQFDRAVEVGESIKLILLALDMAALGDRRITAAELREMASRMRDRNSTLGAWPFPETLNLAAQRDLELDVMDALVDLLEAREHWREGKEKKAFATGDDILQLLGEDRL